METIREEGKQKSEADENARELFHGLILSKEEWTRENPWSRDSIQRMSKRYR